MNGDEVNLPQVDKSMFTASTLLELEHQTDPAPMLAKLLPDEILISVYAYQLQARAKAARFESQVLAARAEMFENVVKVLPVDIMKE